MPRGPDTMGLYLEHMFTVYGYEDLPFTVCNLQLRAATLGERLQWRAFTVEDLQFAIYSYEQPGYPWRAFTVASIYS
jgi:hypothetical protein